MIVMMFKGSNDGNILAVWKGKYNDFMNYLVYDLSIKLDARSCMLCVYYAHFRIAVYVVLCIVIFHRCSFYSFLLCG